MRSRYHQFGLLSTLMFKVCKQMLALKYCLVFLGFFLAGCDFSEKSEEVNLKKQEAAPELPYPLIKLVGRWQSECNHRHFGRPVITSIDFRPGFIRWSNHFYFDRACIRSDEVQRMEYVHRYVEDVRILGNVWAHLYRLEPGLMTGSEGANEKLEVFRSEDNWLYISVDGSGPEYSRPWDLDSNFGLRRLR